MVPTFLLALINLKMKFSAKPFEEIPLSIYWKKGITAYE
jgi:hypothetical protein